MVGRGLTDSATSSLQHSYQTTLGCASSKIKKYIYKSCCVGRGRESKIAKHYLANVPPTGTFMHEDLKSRKFIIHKYLLGDSVELLNEESEEDESLGS